MSVIDDKIVEELANINVKAIIISKINAKIDKILEGKNINQKIDHEIRNRISEEINSKL